MVKHMNEQYLLPKADGLITRSSQEYVRYKLNALTLYLEMTNTAMHNQPWSARYYIDLQAGSGKNQVGTSVELGSPLIALASKFPPTHFRFNEKDEECNEALRIRASSSPLYGRVEIYQDDVNEVVSRICGEISLNDQQARAIGHWSAFNIAFLDPEGLELHWTTVEQLASMNRMDLIINFSTQGLVRAIGSESYDAVDRFFGTDQWKEIDEPHGNPSARRRALIDFYRQRLAQFGYYIDIDPNLGGNDIAVSNSKNSQVYSLIFASKHELGDRFWSEAAKRVKPPRLPGF